MNKKIEYYLHLYLGCRCEVKEVGESRFISILEGVQRGKFLLKEYNHLLLFVCIHRNRISLSNQQTIHGGR